MSRTPTGSTDAVLNVLLDRIAKASAEMAADLEALSTYGVERVACVDCGIVRAPKDARVCRTCEELRQSKAAPSSTRTRQAFR